MIGPIALNPASISSTVDGSGKGHINVATTSKSYTSNVIVNFGPSTNNLSYIDGANFDGQMIFIHVITGNTLTVKTDGNIVTYGTLQQSVTGPAIISFIFDSTLGPNGNAGGWLQSSSGPTAGGGGSNLWSNITIDIDKDMGDHSLVNLSHILFQNLDAKTREIQGTIGSGMIFDLPSGEIYKWNINSLEILSVEASKIKIWQASTVPFDFNDNDIQNLHFLRFYTSGGLQYIGTSGNGLVYDIFTHGFETHTLSNSYNTGATPAVPDNGVLEVTGAAHQFYNIGPPSGTVPIAPSYKTVNTAVLNAGDFIGIYAFDAYDSAINRQTFAQIQTNADVITDTSERASIHFLLTKGDTLTDYLQLTDNTSNPELVPITDIVISLGDSTHRYKSIDVQTVNMYGALSLLGTLGNQGWATDDWPLNDGGANLGTVTGGVRRWNNLYMTGEIFAYINTASTNKFAYMFSDPATEFAFFGMNDATAEKRGAHLGINQTAYLDVVHDPTLGTQTANDYIGSFYTHKMVPHTGLTNNFTIDATLNEGSYQFTLANNTSGNLTNASDSFSGLIIVKNITTGSIGMFLTGGGASILVAQSGADFSATGGNANTTNVYISSNQVMIENKQGANRTYQVFTLRVYTTNS